MVGLVESIIFISGMKIVRFREAGGLAQGQWAPERQRKGKRWSSGFWF